MFDASVYVERRARLAREVGSGLLFFAGNGQSPINYAANTHPFRQDSSFLYFFGLDAPDLNVVIDIDAGRETVFGNDPTVEETIWTGPRESLRDQAARAGITDVAPGGQLAPVLGKARQDRRTVHFLPPYQPQTALLLEEMLEVPPAAARDWASVPFIKAVVAQRSAKSPAELAEIEKALAITREMYLAIMAAARPGLYERDLTAIMAGIRTAAGVSGSFPTILTVKGHVLHNEEHGNRMEAGDLIVTDSGAESALCYASDITRTFPVSGTFDSRQKDVYAVVLQAQADAMAAIRPGVMFRDVHLTACRTLAEGLKGLGLMRGDTAEAVAAGAHALFFPCGLGHMMGLDVHDMEALGEDHVGYDDTVSRSEQFGLKLLRMGRALAPGFVMTVEPGLYFIPDLIDVWKRENRLAEFLDYEKIEEYRNFTGMRVEDDVVVTDAGCRVLGMPIPKTVAEIEAAVAGGR